MTPQEQQMLDELLNKLVALPTPAYDMDAANLIQRKLGTRPDALYILTQTVMMQDMALKQTQQQLQQLQQPAQQASSSFLGPWSHPAAAPQQPAYAPTPQPTAPMGGGFFQSALQTATGVIAGEVAFDALRSVFGGGSHGMGGMGGGFMSDAPRETITNNYYGNDTLPDADNVLDTSSLDDGSVFDDDSNN